MTKRNLFLAAAVKAGDKTYQDGRPCKYGHIGPRYTVSRACVQCTNQRAIERAKANPSRHRELNRLWKINNPDRVKLFYDKSNAKYYAKNKEKVKDAVKRARKRNPDGYRSRNRARQAIEQKAMPEWIRKSDEYKREISNIYRQADILTRMTGVKHHVDHIHPLNHKLICGLHVPWNLQIITETENCRKRNKFKPYITNKF